MRSCPLYSCGRVFKRICFKLQASLSIIDHPQYTPSPLERLRRLPPRKSARPVGKSPHRLSCPHHPFHLQIRSMTGLTASAPSSVSGSTNGFKPGYLILLCFDKDDSRNTVHALGKLLADLADEEAANDDGRYLHVVGRQCHLWLSVGFGSPCRLELSPSARQLSDSARRPVSLSSWSRFRYIWSMFCGQNKQVAPQHHSTVWKSCRKSG
jgi:hypothetical protein